MHENIAERTLGLFEKVDMNLIFGEVHVYLGHSLNAPTHIASIPPNLI